MSRHEKVRRRKLRKEKKHLSNKRIAKLTEDVQQAASKLDGFLRSDILTNKQDKTLNAGFNKSAWGVKNG